MTERLVPLFDALQAERERTWDPAKLHRNVEQRRALVAAFDPATTIAAGDRIAPFSLEWADGRVVTSAELAATGAVALIFFRFAGCPACNIALPYYDRTLAPVAASAGVRLVAVSPHLPETGLGEIAERHGLRYPVAADRGNALGRSLGITFVPDDDTPIREGDQGWIGALTGTHTWELPQPTVVVIDRYHVVRFADVSPDWLRRTEGDGVIAALEDLRFATAA
jgi:peroxiredoxin